MSNQTMNSVVAIKDDDRFRNSGAVF